MTQTDIGSVFEDRNSNKFIIAQIKDKNNFVVYPHFDQLSKDSYSFTNPLSPFTLVSGENTKNRIGFYTDNLEQSNVSLSGKVKECKIVANGKQIDIKNINV